MEGNTQVIHKKGKNTKRTENFKNTMADLSPNISIITFNINYQNTPIKTQRMGHPWWRSG